MVLRYDATAGSVGTWATSPGMADIPPAVTASQVTYHSADGTPVRMVIIEPAGDTSRRSGMRSCILYGYGGFDISLTPAYSASISKASGVFSKGRRCVTIWSPMRPDSMSSNAPCAL